MDFGHKFNSYVLYVDSHFQAFIMCDISFQCSIWIAIQVNRIQFGIFGILSL